MKKFKEFNIPFVGLKQGKHEFDFTIDNAFFEDFDYTEFNSANIAITLVLNKKSSMLELDFKAKGTINVNCDLTNEPFDQPLKGKLYLIVKFGEEYNDENEEILILPHGEYEINVAQYIYEMLVLAVPAKKIHPGIKDGTLNSDILDKLEELQPKEKNIKNNDEDTDPRWDNLKKLLTDK
ncbi:YceD family protein [Zhouia sp. PK063]|uniref:YceD family protein n=1 Tax=Zhouia sp. PK063 TaxID=3373602 RepID=UPI003795BE1F